MILPVSGSSAIAKAPLPEVAVEASAATMELEEEERRRREMAFFNDFVLKGEEEKEKKRFFDDERDDASKKNIFFASPFSFLVFDFSDQTRDVFRV